MRASCCAKSWGILLAGLLAVLLAGACSPPSYPMSFELEDGSEVEVFANGAFRITDATGRPIFATSGSAFPTVRRFDRQINELLGHYEFSRSNEQAVELRHLLHAYRTKHGVRIALRSDPAAFGGTAPFKAVISIEPEIPGESTRIELRQVSRSDGKAKSKSKGKSRRKVKSKVRTKTKAKATKKSKKSAKKQKAKKQAKKGVVPAEMAPPPDSLALPLLCDAAATFYGFGGQYNATDQRGEAFELFVSEQGIGRNPALPRLPLNGTAHTTYFPMPYFLDARGFGVLARTDQRVQVDLCAASPDVAWLEVEGDEALELVLFHGPEPLDVVRQLGEEVGRPPALPSWAYGLWIGAQGGQQDVLDEVALLAANQVPVQVLWVQDWTGERINFDGGKGVQYRWETDPLRYPDLPGMIAQLRGQGIRFLGYANPFVDSNLPNHFPDMDAQGLLVKDAGGSSKIFIAPNGLSAHPDLTNPAAQAYIKDFLRAMVSDIGMDGWMSDFGEWAPIDGVYLDGSDPVAAHNRFPVEWHRLWREVMDEERPDGDYVVFARSGWTGVQAVSQVHWVGDQETNWDVNDGLPTVVPAMLNLGISGVPFVTHDIAGFSGTTAPPSTKELFQRWTELGAFTPIMRTHEGADQDNNWSWESDAETTTHFRRFARIHDALAPEFQSLGAAAAQDSTPLLRHLMLEYPTDPTSRSVSDQFLLGDSLLVAPVVVEGAVQRDVYLPPGATWFHLWTGTAYAGGQTVYVSAPIGEPPVFSKDVDRPDLRAIQ